MSYWKSAKIGVALLVATAFYGAGIGQSRAQAFGASFHFVNKLATAAAYGDGLAQLYLFLLFAGIPLDDPYFVTATIKDHGNSFRDSTGFTGATIGSRTTMIGGGVDSQFNLAHTFHLSNSEQLRAGVSYQRNSYRTTFDTDPFAPAVGSAGSVRQTVNRLNAFARYDFGANYFGVLAEKSWGGGTETDNVLGATGNFDTDGYKVIGTAGHIFTLFDNTPAVYTSALPTKAPSRTASSGYALKLDVGGHLGYSHNRTEGFTDTAGNTRSDDNLNYWLAGGHAKLFALTTTGRFNWSPYVAGTVTRQFDYSHQTFFPAQFGGPATTVDFGSAQTFWGAQVGVDVVDVSGVSFGINAYHRTSAQYDATGGQVYLRMPVLRWLGLTSAP